MDMDMVTRAPYEFDSFEENLIEIQLQINLNLFTPKIDYITH